MKMDVTIILYGSLRQSMPPEAGSGLTIAADEPLPLQRLLEAAGVPIDRVQLAMVNHRAVDITKMVSGGDRVAIFPKEYPIFVDWSAYRF